MKALIDYDILRYEVSFAAEASWRYSNPELGSDALPPWDYVEACLHNKVDKILEATGATDLTMYMTNGPTFRDQVAVSKPYKGTRTNVKPFHFKNLSVYGPTTWDCKEERGLEADDLMAIEHTKDPDNTVICSRDKDLRQVPGWLYSWEVGRQAEFGPTYIEEAGSLDWDQKKNKLIGTGYLFFCAQMIMGDSADNIPGLPGQGPKAAWTLLNGSRKPKIMLGTMRDAYSSRYKGDYDWKDYLKEQAQLLWLVRSYNPDNTPDTLAWELKGP